MDATACHFRELYVNHKGDIFPCCMTWHRPEMHIANVEDSDVWERIINYSGPPCRCKNRELRSAGQDEVPSYALINIEFSLACQGRCVMCCVNAPEWKGGEQNYGAIRDLIRKISTVNPIEAVLAQGGEILIQKRTIDFLEAIKAEYPGIKMAVVTNGNVPSDAINRSSSLFSQFTVSFYAFQPETYQCISGLDLSKTISFSEHIMALADKTVYLKYLSTPLSIHEIGAFFRWSLALAPAQIQLVTGGFAQFVQSAEKYKYWRKILAISSKSIQRELLSADWSALRHSRTKILIDGFHRSAFGLDSDFIERYGLEDILYHYPGQKETVYDEWRLDAGDVISVIN